MPDERGGASSANSAHNALPDRAEAFFAALQTEHYALQAARGVTVSESSSRASTYLMTLSSALVAFGFLAQTPSAAWFLGFVIPAVVALGIFTFERLVETTLEDVAALAAMQRIRGWYGQLLPRAESYFPRPLGSHAPNELLDIGHKPSWRGMLFTMSSEIAAVNSILAGAGMALLMGVLGAGDAWSIAMGIGTAVMLLILHGVYQYRRFVQLRDLIGDPDRTARI